MDQLPELPDSKNEFWDGEVQLKNVSKSKSHDHSFKYESSREIRCECGFGLVISQMDRLKDGHLYHGDEFIV